MILKTFFVNSIEEICHKKSIKNKGLRKFCLNLHKLCVDCQTVLKINCVTRWKLQQIFIKFVERSKKKLMASKNITQCFQKENKKNFRNEVALYLVNAIKTLLFANFVAMECKKSYSILSRSRSIF